MLENGNPGAAATATGVGDDVVGLRRVSNITSPNPAPAWRSLIAVHAAADLFPMMSDGELDELAKDIEANNLLRTPLSIWRSMPGAAWQLLDGRNRVAAMARLPDGKDRIEGAIGLANQYESNTDPVAFVVSANVRRRHLTPDQKSDLIKVVLKNDPTLSNRAIGSITKTDHHKVADVRNGLASTGEIPPVDKTVGVDGKTRIAQPAYKPPPSKEQQLRAMRERLALAPIVPESQRPVTALAAAISQPDAQMIADTTRRIGLAIPPLLVRDPVGGLGHIAKVIEGTGVANVLSRAQRIDMARAFLVALNLQPEDFGG